MKSYDVVTENTKKIDRHDYLSKGDFVYRNGEAIIFTGSENVWLYDQDGNRYLDAEAANGTVGLGYDKTLLSEAFQRTSGSPGFPSFLETEARLSVAKKLTDIFNNATSVKGRIAFEVGGAQGVELAIKIARLFTQSDQLITVQGGYHGRSVYTSQLSTSQRYRDSSPACNQNILRLPYPDPEHLAFGINNNEFNDILSDYCQYLMHDEIGGFLHQKSKKICGIIIEPVLNAGGMVYPDKRWVESVVKSVREMGGLVIVDEVFTGMYRVGPQWGFQLYDITPDIIVASKALSNGLTPISCVWGREPIMSPENFPPGTHSTTHCNNVLSMSIVDTILDRYSSIQGLDQKLSRLESNLNNIAEAVLENSPLVKKIQVCGATARLVLDKPVASLVREHVLKSNTVHSKSDDCKGIVIASTGMCNNVLALHPPFTFSDEHSRITRDYLISSLHEVNKNIV